MLPTSEEIRENFQQQHQIPVQSALEIIHAAQGIFNSENNVIELSAPMIICGDLHGQFYDLMHFADMKQLDEPNETRQFLFLGDYVDRGAFSCEVMLYLLLLKCKYPKFVHLLRGNHECEAISSFYGFRTECTFKYGLSVYYHFVKCFQSMPLVAVVSTCYGRFLCVHGGLSPEIETIDHIQAINRKCEPQTSGAMCDLLWSDPAPEDQAGIQRWRSNDVRGCSYQYGCVAVFDFLERNDLISIVRAHELQQDGYSYHFSSQTYAKYDKRSDRTIPPVITVFSAPNYCDQRHNLAAHLVVSQDRTSFRVDQFADVIHPSPQFFSTSKSLEIESQMRRIFPYLPANSELFDLICTVTEEEERLKSNPSVKVKSTNVKRRKSAEIHPDAMRHALDVAVDKWIMDEQEILTQEEIEVVKLMFSLMDVNGDLNLGVAEIQGFVRNILSDPINEDTAKKYLEAMDVNKDGMVCFTDLLRCVALLKVKLQQTSSSSPRLTSSSRRIRRPASRGNHLILASVAVALTFLVRRFKIQKRYGALAFCLAVYLVRKRQHPN